MNWAVDAASSAIYPVRAEDYFRKYPLDYGLAHEASTCSVAIGSHLKSYFAELGDGMARKVNAQPFIVPPSWNKVGYHKAIAPVWRAAARHLGEATEIFVIGYSLPETDQFFRLLYGLGAVGDHPLHRFVVYNPDREIPARYLSLLGPGARDRFEFYPIAFSSVADHVRQLFPARLRR